jgi:hypothetical protein
MSVMGSPVRLLMAAVLAAAAACGSADKIAGPGLSDAKGSANTLGLLSDDDGPEAPSTHRKMSDDEARNDPDFGTATQTTFPVTEAVYNTCRNELVVLNGYITQRTALVADPNFGTAFFFKEWKDTRGVFGTVEIWEDYDHDNNPLTPKQRRKRIVTYRNRESLLDAFVAGPLGLPFFSIFESKMYLQREGPDPLAVTGIGDDLFVFVKQVEKIDRFGNVRTEHSFRSECK